MTFTDNLFTTNAVQQAPADFASLLEQYDIPRPRQGDILMGEIMHLDEESLYLDVGAKREAIVPYAELSKIEDDVLDDLNEGDEVPVYVKQTPIDDELLFVSLERGLQELDWERAAKLDLKKPLELEIVGYNRGGLLAEFGRILGFIPNSHVPTIRNLRDDAARQEGKRELLHSRQEMVIIELNPQKRKFVLSIRKAQEITRKQRLLSLQVGDVVQGTVTKVMPYGAFMDFNDGLSGLLHISKIGRHFIDDIKNVVAVNDSFSVLIDAVEIETGRVSLNRVALD